MVSCWKISIHDLGKPVPSGYRERRSGHLEAVARMVVAHPTIERCFVVLRRSAGVFVQPFVEGGLQRVNIPVGEFAADLGNRPFRERADERTEKWQVMRAGCLIERRLPWAGCLPLGRLPFLLCPLPCIFTLHHVDKRLPFGLRPNGSRLST